LIESTPPGLIESTPPGLIESTPPGLIETDPLEGFQSHQNKIGKIGGTCPSGLVIRRKDECDIALKNLGISMNTTWWVGTSADIPSGCAIRNGGDRMPHFNQNSGVGIGRSDLIPICQRPYAACTCDKRGLKFGSKVGNWCFLSKAPCKLLDGQITPANWTWIKCTRINCPTGVVVETGKIGGTCPSGLVIRRKDECDFALKNLGISMNTRWWAGTSSAHIPSGCTIRNGGDRMPHFNQNSGVGIGRSDLIPICQRPVAAGKIGGTCPSGLVIRRKDECDLALKNLGISMNTAWWVGTSADIPSGCAIRNDGDRMPHFNQNSGVGIGRSDLIPICQRP